MLATRTAIIILWLGFCLPLTTQAADTPPLGFSDLHTFRHEANCPEAEHAKAADQLKALKEADRNDRTGGAFDDLAARDKARRRMVAQIASDGCLKTAEDYVAAALVYQHGQLPDHYLHAATYAAEAARLGHPQGRGLQRAAVDRYLMSLGRAQVFATQMMAPVYYRQFESEADALPCLWPVDETVAQGPLGGAEADALLEMQTQAAPQCDYDAAPAEPLYGSVIALQLTPNAR
jgi:hypothetical protein